VVRLRQRHITSFGEADVTTPTIRNNTRCH
jgi:hypothetical protein